MPGWLLALCVVPLGLILGFFFFLIVVLVPGRPAPGSPFPLVLGPGTVFLGPALHRGANLL